MFSKEKNSRPNVFSQPVRKLSADEVQAVTGAGPYTGPGIGGGPKSVSDVDNQGKNFS